ncbi:MAG: ATP-binding protein, partial [Pseudomonadota bacterium]
LASTPRRLEDNSIVWDGVQVDITERVQHEEEKGRLEALLRQSQKMEALGTLSGGIAHDFNNILGVIMGYAEVAQLLSEQGQANRQEVGQIVRAAERARDLVRQILTFSRRVEASLRPLDINQVITQIADLLEHTLPKMIEVRCQLGKGLGLVNADANQLEQLFLNLANNAADAMPEGGQLVIETRLVDLDEEYSRCHLEMTPGRYVVIVVTDTGQGMEQATQEKMFEPFFTTKAVGKGTGLGLSTVFGIVKGHEGHIRCYSQPGLGTAFSVYLPSFDADCAPADGESRLADEQLRGAETVLLVDDEEGLRQAAAKVLGDMGYRVLTAASGEEALAVRAAADLAIDLVVMDLGMPGMGGRECMRAMLAADPAARIIIASGYATAGQEKLVKESGARWFLAKPFNRINLLTMVRRVLGPPPA